MKCEFCGQNETQFEERLIDNGERVLICMDCSERLDECAMELNSKQEDYVLLRKNE